ncbi:hypothetical protein [Actinacidiphila soli]|uniref:hypothetical protein n=1 Tax=Actinacidiphila soli TaxID=2487275 RepID=UPI0019D18F55|nr:hypothetical protein [Actinacidiphila soli]
MLNLDHDAVQALIERWRADPSSTYRSWFLREERVKNFRSIRRGIEQVVREIEEGTFGADYKGSLLQTVVGSIAEQRQMFRGADPAFLWAACPVVVVLRSGSQGDAAAAGARATPVSARPRSVSPYITSRPSRREAASPAVGNCRRWWETSFYACPTTQARSHTHGETWRPLGYQGSRTVSRAGWAMSPARTSPARGLLTGSTSEGASCRPLGDSLYGGQSCRMSKENMTSIAHMPSIQAIPGRRCFTLAWIYSEEGTSDVPSSNRWAYAM